MTRHSSHEIPTPYETEEQTALFQWAELQSVAQPELELMYHCPNGGSRNKIEAARLKAQGVRAGVPDICLPVPRGGYHGLYIELKRTKGGRISDQQKNWMNALAAQGYAVALCRGFYDAQQTIIQYLTHGRISPE